MTSKPRARRRGQTTAGRVPAESSSMATKKNQQGNGENGSSDEAFEFKVSIKPEVVEHRRNRVLELLDKLEKVTDKKREVSDEYRAKEKELKKEIKELRDEIDTGLQKVTTKVREEPELRTMRMIKRRLDNSEVVFERAMTAAEHKKYSQVTLEEVIASKEAGDKANGKSNGKAERTPEQSAQAERSFIENGSQKGSKGKRGKRKTRDQIEQEEGGLV